MITDFEVQDFGILPFDSLFAFDNTPTNFQYSVVGCGTDAESALDDLLEGLAPRFDVTNLEGRIKWEWLPSDEEGDGKSMYWLGILFNEDK